ncbi:MAG: IclR family transcriptional regulator [Guyparkeria sp.]
MVPSCIWQPKMIEGNKNEPMMAVMDTLPRALERGLRLLEFLVSRDGGASYSAIARHLEISNAAATRLLTGMRDAGYLAHDGHRYHPGPRLEALLAPGPGPERLRRCARPHLESVAHATGHTVILVWFVDGELVCLDRVVQDEAHSMQSPGRRTAHLRAYPWGWFLPDRRAWRRECNVGCPGGHPLPDDTTIDQALADLDHEGYTVAVDPYLHRIGAPIHDRRGHTVAAFGLAGDARTLPTAAIPAVGRELSVAARACSRELGFAALG